ncbi:hypothetical protein [Croceibacterium mercuriale]|uniref:hypothetical protein n=1 Tax=Croceibacterium mercuriale TaxID=1572751 RepID=UPI000690312F|nr:hypothetical protein [Croceibacterium mercuriale]
MATANPLGQRPRFWPRAVLAALVLAIGGLWFAWPTLDAYATTAASFGARTACSCRHIGGRALSDCTRDFEPGMAMVFLSEDEDARSVTATVPLLARQTATYAQGPGCVLEPWAQP